MTQQLLMEIPSLETISKQLESVYRGEVGKREVGHNSGKDVEPYQKAVDGKAQKEPYCLGFIQWGANKVCAIYNVKNPLYPTEHCYTLWQHTPDKYKEKSAAPGRLGVMKSRTSSDGHIFYDVAAGLIKWPTIEANTNTAGSREGDGVYASTRYATGTVTKKILGHINLALMIQDAIIKASYPKISESNGTVTSAAPNSKGDWSARLDSEVIALVTPTMINLPASRMKKFMPDWAAYPEWKRKRFFADLLFAMTRPESDYDTMTMFQEPDSMGRDKVTGYPVISEGLLQLSYQDATRYPGIEFDYLKDAELFKLDMQYKAINKSSWKSKNQRTINDPVLNVRAATIIIGCLLERFPKDEFADCLGRYWSCMRRFKKDGWGRAIYRPSFLGICRVLKSKGYKT